MKYEAAFILGPWRTGKSVALSRDSHPWADHLT